MTVISNILRNFAVAICQSLKEKVTVSQNSSTAIPIFSRTNPTYTASLGLFWCQFLRKKLTSEITS